MKHWCFYANVVRNLERLEAGAAQKKPGGAYLVWSDDEGPHMIAGPDIDWHRGAGPMPDLEGLNISARPPVRARNASDGSASERRASDGRASDTSASARPNRKAPLTAARVSKRSLAAALSTRAARVSKRSVTNALSTRTAQNTPPTATKHPSRRTTTHKCRKTTHHMTTACRVEPTARHNPEVIALDHGPSRTGETPLRKANKRRTTFPKPAQTCSRKQQACLSHAPIPPQTSG